MATSRDEAIRIAHEISYPVLVRPSYVLGGRGMEIVYDDATLDDYITRVTEASPENPVMVDKFLDDAVEIDVDALYDGTDLYLGGIMEHIEEAGVHSGDSSCSLPPITLGKEIIDQLRESTLKIAQGVGVRGLINIQYALAGETLYVLEANPRASRTVPFVSKATGTQLSKAAALIMMGATIAELRESGRLRKHVDGAATWHGSPIAVKEAVMPFNRFRTSEGTGVDTVLGPEMRSTGEVMGFDRTFGNAFAKSQIASYGPLPKSGRVFVSVNNADKRHAVFPIKRLADLGFEIYATSGTAEVLARHGIDVVSVRKYSEGGGPNNAPTVVDMILDGQIQFVFNTPHGRSATGSPRRDGYEIRTAAIHRDIPCITTVQGLAAAVQAIEAARDGEMSVRSLQAWGDEVTAALGTL
jgi:carbamoyl-phosphate synthase large subunit